MGGRRPTFFPRGSLSDAAEPDLSGRNHSPRHSLPRPARGHPRSGGRPIDAIPGPIPSNVRLASYLPFEWVLPKVDVFVTNGGYGSVNQAMSFGIPLVTAGLTEDKADVNARVAWSGVGIDLATNEPTPQALREAIRTVLDKPSYRLRASLMADEFAGIDTRSAILRIVSQVLQISNEDGLRRSAVAENRSTQTHLNANHLAPID